VLWPPDPRRARRILVPSLPIHPPPPIPARALFQKTGKNHATSTNKSLRYICVRLSVHLYIPFFKRWLRLHPDILVPSLPIHSPPPIPEGLFQKALKITQPRQINLYGGFMSDCPSIYTFHSSKGGCCFIQISWRPSYPSIRHHLYTQEHYYFRISAKNHATSTNKSDCPFIRSILQ